MKKLLFICSRNKLRSPTAEQVFSQYPNLEVESAGLNNDAENIVTPESILWADIIFVMEKTHKTKLSKKYKQYLNRQKVVCLDISDRYDYMSPDLIKILETKVIKYLGTY